MFKVDENKYHYWLEQLEQIRFRVDRFLLMPKHEEWLRREAFVRQAYSSTMIENPSISVEELEKAESQLTIGRPDVANYARALELVDFLSTDNELIISESLIRQLHWSLMRGIRDHHYLPGEYRTSTNWIEDRGVKVYQPPHQVDVGPLMRDFIMGLRQSQLHPLLTAGMAHLHLVAIHPFVDGNGRVARLLAPLVLQNSGWGFRNLLSLDSRYQRTRDQYVNALASSLGTKFSQDYDAAPWLEFFCLAVLLEARRLESRLTGWQMSVDEIHKDLRPLGLLDRQIDGFLYASRKGTITRKEYAEIAAVSPLTATRDLTLLATKGYLKPEGMGRNRKYRMAAEVAPKQTRRETETTQQRLIQ